MGGDIVRVLIVEDDPAFRDLYAWYLRGDTEQRLRADRRRHRGRGHRDLSPRPAGLRHLRLPASRHDRPGAARARSSDGTGVMPFATIMVSAHASTELATAALERRRPRLPGQDPRHRDRLCAAPCARPSKRAGCGPRSRPSALRGRRAGPADSPDPGAVTDGFFALDRSWRFTFVNPVAEQTFGARAGQPAWRATAGPVPGPGGLAAVRGAGPGAGARRADLLRDAVRASPKLAGAARLPGRRRALGLLPRRHGSQAGRGRARAPARAWPDAAAGGAGLRGRGRSPAAGRLDRRGGDAAARRRPSGGGALGRSEQDADADRDHRRR